MPSNAWKQAAKKWRAMYRIAVRRHDRDRRALDRAGVHVGLDGSVSLRLSGSSKPGQRSEKED